MGWEVARAMAVQEELDAEARELAWLYEKAEMYGLILLDPNDPDDLADLLQALTRKKKA